MFFWAWSSITLLFYLRKETKEVGGLPLLPTMKKLLEILDLYRKERFVGRWIYSTWLWLLGTSSALICPSVLGDCEGEKLPCHNSLWYD